MNTRLDTETTLHPVAASRPLAPWQGGKRVLAKSLCALIEATPHATYAEPFVGMGGVFFRRTARPDAEFINDWSLDVVDLFRVVQVHLVPFLDFMRYQVTSRAEFSRLSATDPDTLTDIQRAARFLYLQRTGFGGKVMKRGFGVSTDRPARFDISKLRALIEDVHERLAGVTIERLPWADFIRRYDRPGTLFYLDPPYFGCEDDYGRDMFARSEFEEMAALLAGLKGRFILSLNDHPEVRRIFAGFQFEEVSACYSVGSANDKAFGELIIHN